VDNYLIYKHTSPSGKSYIGQTNNYDRRCREHQSSTDCRYLSRAIKKYGWDSFQHELLIEGLSLDEANRWEEVLIKELNTLAPNGYNLNTGGLNSRLSEETKAKMTTAKRNMSVETKAKMSIAHLGKKQGPHTEDTKAKMRAAKQNISDETRAKMSAAKQGKKRRPTELDNEYR
jgi:group I intron endonuclease